MGFRKARRAEIGYDYVVVGAGAAGCAVAARLSRLEGASVLLMEAGGFSRNPLLGVPAAAVLSMRTPRYSWRYDTEAEDPDPARASSLMAGRMVGGGTGINGLMYLRGHPRDYDRWRDVAGCPGWGYDDILPFFRRSEASERGENAYHGGSGPIGTSRGRASLPIGAAFLEACARSGLPVVDDLNALTGEGAGLYDLMARGGRRSMAGDYLRHVADARGLTVITDALVTGIDIQDGRARAIDYVHRGRRRRVEAGRDIIVAAGCINTTQLLLLSGIGPATDLTSHGIAVRVDAPQVGANLQNHAAASLHFAFDAGMTATDRLRGGGLLTAGIQYLAGRSGILAELPTPAGALIHADGAGADATPDTQIILGAGLPGKGRGWNALLSGTPGFMLMVNQGRPESRGSIRLRSADPLAPPLIRNGFFRCDGDRNMLAHAVHRARAIAENGFSAAIGVQPQLSSRFALEDDVDALARTIHRHVAPYYHMVGSCRMGTDAGAVVDPELRVRGIAGLRIADTSVAPLLVNGNTSAMAFMIGERAADFIRADADKA
ncbi:choline dehydrogenase [Sphingobium sp. OAS761]|uniref:GMC family oxidoreductase n=1 Tax=Sphingobium sp. OAS761 TaxID=2817901 RepID=UPI00209DC62F|nr:GMC family oxidoreductase N-terminal domain-containing protein [Sphingobium sp. OAS761]MCP1468605.1 choline dehydrogenase [Sphingobium sp. OAS761]